MKRALPFLLVLVACGTDGPSPPAPSPKEQQHALEEANQRAMRIEERDITGFVARHHLDTRTSGTGVRWQLLRDMPGDSARPDDVVKVAYRMELIDGKVAYESAPGQPESFRVEHDEVESGLHEAVQHLSPGDSAIVIIPSYRAFGLIGDQQRVPPRSTVIYHIALIDVRSR